MKKILAIPALLLVFAGAGNRAAVVPAPNGNLGYVTHQELFFRTELYFGRSIPGGGSVSEEEWEKFLTQVVTPRFPDGFTVLKATGHYRERTGKIIIEPSEVLVFHYPANKRTASRRKIEEIRRAYVKQFRQESVLRMDLPRAVVVYF
jgi:hypothetical protein